jgi:hypothetical protein
MPIPYPVFFRDLSSCGLGPAIPAPLGSLLELSILYVVISTWLNKFELPAHSFCRRNLAANSFSDPVPAFIGDLQNLTELFVAVMYTLRAYCAPRILDSH